MGHPILRTQEAALVAVAAEVTEALRSKGPGGQHSESLSTLLGLLASLTDSSSPTAQQYITASGPSGVNTNLHGATISNTSSHADATVQDTHSQSHGTQAATKEQGSATKIASEQKRKSDSSEERPQQRLAKAYAAGALVQAALNAMAAGVQGPQPLTFLTPTSSAAAAIAVQVRTPAVPIPTLWKCVHKLSVWRCSSQVEDKLVQYTCPVACMLLEI